MIVSGAIFFSALLQIVRSSEVHYEVPEPLFEVFSPKGLRVSIPDSRNVESVEFFISIPRTRETLQYTAENPEQGYWMYWNPDIAVSDREEIQYRLMVKHLQRYWSKEGIHMVQNERQNSGRSNDTDCEEMQGQRVITGVASLEEARNQLGKISCSGKSPHFKSLFTFQKDSDLKPITKSTTSTTSGTFYLTPSGEIEATGYKSESSFDSTKSLGEQWQHHRSDLTAEDLENMKKMYNSGFFGFRNPAGRFFPESTTNEMNNIKHGENSGSIRHFEGAHETHESSFGQARPELRFQFGNSERGESADSGSKLPNPLPLHGGIMRTREYIRKEHTVPDGGSVSSQASFHANEFSKRIQKELSRRGYPSMSHLEFNAGNPQTIESRSGSYHGNIFTSVKSATHPQECFLTPGIDFAPSENVIEVERFARELSCLASFAESSVKKEINRINLKNVELERKLEWLEHEMKRLTSSCKCY